MNRRHFLRLTGAFGAALPLGFALNGCSAEVPPEAIAAWRAPDASGDIRLWILSYAILAPNSHNRQGWLVDLSEPDAITLWLDHERLLPETDPLFRQIIMSQGTFLELLDQAARERGLRADITLFPQGLFDPGSTDYRPVARVRLVEDGAIRPDPLFAQVLQRHTNREAYALRIPSSDALQSIAAAVGDPGFRVGFVTLDDVDAIERQRRIASEAWKIELTTPRTFLESLAVLRVGPEEIARHRDGISVNEPLLRLVDGLGLLDRSKAPAPDDRAITSQIETFDERIASTPAFFWLISARNGRVDQINAGRAWVRAQLAATAAGLSMQPISQALQEFPEMADHYHQIHAELGALAAQETVQLWARLGYAPTIEPAPRRGLQAHLMAV